MNEAIAISIKQVGKAYRIWDTPLDRLHAPLMETMAGLLPAKAALAQSLRSKAESKYHDFWALKDVDFEVRKGESIGIIGRNGSGKSTLLQIIAGTLQPTTGSVTVNGRVAALLELGSGFNPEFTGRENVYLNGAVLGLSRADVDNRFESIPAFADIGDFIDQPVKTYSSGMLMRLAFAVQVQVEPDILIVDEAIAVGDILFQKRCFEKMQEMRTRGTTILLVSHELESVRTITERALLLKGGNLRAIGSSAEIILEYRRQMHDEEKLYLNRVAQTAAQPATAPTPANAISSPSLPTVYGDGEALIEGVRVLDETLSESNVFRPGEKVVVEIHYRMLKPLTHLNVGFRLRSKEGVKVYSGGTFNQDLNRWHREPEHPSFWSRTFASGEQLRVRFAFECRLGPNFYELQAYICEERERAPDHQRMILWKDEAAFFTVTMDRHEYWFGGMCDLRLKIDLHDSQ